MSDNYLSDLNELIISQRFQKKQISRFLGITQKTLENKMNRVTNFTTDEMFKLAMLLDISDSDLKKFFYSSKVENNSTN